MHGVYTYTGYTYVESTGTSKLVAVDVEFRDYASYFDLDDVEIHDGASNESHGSDPHIAFLTAEGKVVPRAETPAPSDELGPLRVLLIYSFPKDAQTIKLSYWGKELTPKPIPIAGIGPSLSKPDGKE